MMARLVATYTEGFFAVFTENRTGMQQRALIDIGDKVPTPKEMAELAGTLSDHWGWEKQIQPPTAKPAKAIANNKPREYTSPKATGEPVGEYRHQLILDYLAKHPESDQREILKGLGFEDTHARLARWHHAFAALMKANRIVGKTVSAQNQRGGIYRRNLYSLP
jgi:hypothetical protein